VSYRDDNRNRNGNKYRPRDRRQDKDFIPLGVTVRYTGDSEEQKTLDLEKALSRFKKIISKSGLVLEMREREYYKSPSRKKYEKRKKFLYRLQLKKEKNKPGHSGTKRGKDKKKGKRYE